MSLTFRDGVVNGKSKEDLKSNLYISKDENGTKFEVVINGIDWDFVTKVDNIVIGDGLELVKVDKSKSFRQLRYSKKGRS
jgi:hypothetical protein